MSDASLGKLKNGVHCGFLTFLVLWYDTGSICVVRGRWEGVAIHAQKLCLALRKRVFTLLLWAVAWVNGNSCIVFCGLPVQAIWD